MNYLQKLIKFKKLYSFLRLIKVFYFLIIVIFFRFILISLVIIISLRNLVLVILQLYFKRLIYNSIFYSLYSTCLTCLVQSFLFLEQIRILSIQIVVNLSRNSNRVLLIYYQNIEEVLQSLNNITCHLKVLYQVRNIISSLDSI